MPYRALVLALAVVSAPAAAETEWPTRGWKSSAPAVLDELDRELAGGKHGHVDSMLVIRNGRVVYEKSYRNDYVRLFEGRDRTRGPYNYYDPDWHPYYKGGSGHTMQSVSKSVTSALIGIAIREGRIPGVGVEVLPYFEGLRTRSFDPRWRKLTLRDLLTMTSGIEWDESTVDYTDARNSCARMEASENWVQFVLDRPMAEEPGTTFVYNSGVTELLGEILRKATGKDPDDYAAEHLFAPLGIERWYWKKTPAGLSDTEGGLYLEARDLAKIGYLYLHDGVWEGKRILPEGWVRDSTTGHVDASESGARRYGYQWWLLPYDGGSRWASAGLGYGGQFLFVVPEQDLVAVFTGWNIYGGPSFPASLALERVLASVRPRAEEDDVLYVWAWDTDQKSSDFLAVVDVSSREVVASVPVSVVGGAHHTEHRMPEGKVFFANSFTASRTYFIAWAQISGSGGTLCRASSRPRL